METVPLDWNILLQGGRGEPVERGLQGSHFVCRRDNVHTSQLN